MNSKRAFLVLGPESTGTRLATRILVENGCHGDDSHFQPFDSGEFGELSPIVWRRSVPHSATPLDLAYLVETLPGYAVSVVVTIRAWTPTMISHLERRYALDLDSARDRLAESYLSIFSQLAYVPIPYTMLVYESLVLHPYITQRALLEALDLPARSFVSVRDEDAKRWNEYREREAAA